MVNTDFIMVTLVDGIFGRLRDGHLDVISILNRDV